MAAEAIITIDVHQKEILDEIHAVLIANYT